MKLKMLLVVLAVVASASSALAAGPYLGASLGVSIIHDSDVHDSGIDGTFEYDPGFTFNLAGGYNFDPVRLEAEFGYRNASVDRASAPALGLSGTPLIPT